MQTSARGYYTEREVDRLGQNELCADAQREDTKRPGKPHSEAEPGPPGAREVDEQRELGQTEGEPEAQDRRVARLRRPRALERGAS